MTDHSDEWWRQAEYDIETADVMLHSGRHFYAVFICHLYIEKALKGLYFNVTGQVPPKTHNLLYLLDQIGDRPEQELQRFVTRLNTASIATRYPDDLVKMQAVYTADVAKAMIADSKKVLQWVKMKLYEQ